MFPKFFRTLPSETQANSARIAVMNKYGWTKVATLHETEAIFTSVRATYLVMVNVCIYTWLASFPGRFVSKITQLDN